VVITDECIGVSQLLGAHAWEEEGDTGGKDGGEERKRKA